jgi:hypothetical protein
MERLDESDSRGCGKLLLAMAMMQAISELRHVNSGELVLIRSLRIHV